MYVCRDTPTAASDSIETTDTATPEQKERKPLEENQPPSPNALKVAATECLNSWIYYLQVFLYAIHCGFGYSSFGFIDVE